MTSVDASALKPKIPDRGRSVVEDDRVGYIAKLAACRAHLGFDAHLVDETAIVDGVEEAPKGDGLAELRTHACHLVVQLPERSTGAVGDPGGRVVRDDPSADHADRRVGEVPDKSRERPAGQDRVA